MKGQLDRFRSDCKGAVTADYVMLVAAVVAMGFSGMHAIRAGAFDGIKDILEVVDRSGCATTNSDGITDLTACN